MNEVSYERAQRCFVVIFNEKGLDIASQLLSNLFDIAVDYVYRDLVRQREAYNEHRRQGGSIKNWENGVPLA